MRELYGTLILFVVVSTITYTMNSIKNKTLSIRKWPDEDKDGAISAIVIIWPVLSLIYIIS
jgi:hypothetical protein